MEARTIVSNGSRPARSPGAPKPTRSGDLTMGAVARRAFDAAAAISRCESLPELEVTTRRGTQPLGYTSVVLGEVKSGRFKFLAGNWPEAFMTYFLRSGFMAEDVVFRATLERSKPFFWTSVTERPDLTPHQHHIIAERARFGFREGFTSALHHRDGRVTFVTMAGFTIDSANPEVRAASHVLADCYGLAARRLTSADPAPQSQVSLTTRQIDCLRWVLEGKSGADIGTILGISAYTVQEHLTDACARLGVRTRVQAVVAALTLNLLPSELTARP